MIRYAPSEREREGFPVCLTCGQTYSLPMAAKLDASFATYCCIDHVPVRPTEPVRIARP